MNKIELLSEEEIHIVCKNADLELFLKPIKIERYKEYAKNLGRLDKKSVLVQKRLGGIAFKLYKKGEKPFEMAIELQLETYYREFGNNISKMEPSVSIDDIKKYNEKNISKLYFKVLDIYNTDIPIDLFFIFLKLHDIIFNAETIQSIKSEIISQIRILKIQQKQEIQNALNEQEKRLLADFEQQKQNWEQLFKEKDSSYKKIQERLSDTEQNLQKYVDITQKEKKNLEEKWLSAYEKKLEARKHEDNIKREEALSKAKEEQRELISMIEVENRKRMLELEEQYKKQQKLYKEMIDNEKSELKAQIEKLFEKKNELDIKIENLEEKKLSLGIHIQRLLDTEEKYFACFEERIIDKKIDDIIFQKLGYRSSNDYEDRQKTSSKIDTSGMVIVPTKIFSEDKKYEIGVDSIEDFFEDYKDNLSLNFKNETNIAGLVLAAILNRKGIIAVDKICEYLSESLSALLDTGSPLIINIESENVSLEKIVKIINTSESHVVCIKGVLDNYNEILFTRICELCKEKNLFFSVLDLEKLDMMSKAIMNYGIIIDAEDELHFSENEDLLLGKYSLKLLIPKLDIQKIKEIYKEIFKRLVTNNYVNKLTAIEYSNIVQLYFELVEGTILDKIVQKSIINICSNSSEDENFSDILEKSGITILD